MRYLQHILREQNLWPRIAVILNAGFLALTIVIWLLGNQVLAESENSVLEHRLTITQIVANQIDGLLEQVIHELELATLSTDFDPLDPNLEAEAEVLEYIATKLDPTIMGVFILDQQGKVVLAHRPESNLSATVLSGLFRVAQGFIPQGSFVSQPYAGGPDETLVAPVLVPIEREDRIVGQLVATVDLSNPVIKNTLIDAVSLGETAHAVLVDEQGRSIVSTFDLPVLSTGEHVTFYRRAISEGRAVVEEVPFELDLPGEPLGHHHIMAFVPLKTARWGVSVGGDVGNETFADVWRLYLGLAVFSLLAVALIWVAMLITTRQLLVPVGEAILKFDFRQKITDIDDWDELVRYAVRIPFQIAPVIAARLSLFNRDTGMIELVSEWKKNGDESEIPTLPSNYFSMCDSCSQADESAIHSLIPCTYRDEHQTSDWVNSFCLPLKHQDSPVGTLQFTIQEDEQLLRNQVEILTNLAPEMAMAIESFQLHRSTLMIEAEITLLERQRIARYLHDTLGQKVSFLRLRLDQLSNEITTQEIHELQRDIKRMGTIANEAYDQIRVSLVELQSGTQSELEGALQKRGRAVAERAHLEFTLTTEGNPIKIPHLIKRRVLFICTEALNNIEQHANAKKFSIHLQWRHKELVITIRDDGYGFEPTKSPPAGHYGTDIMHERAQVIGGKLFITSEPGAGTEVLLWLPIQS
jgi:signal transduction histidine kinase